jgi:hypothetical protein
VPYVVGSKMPGIQFRVGISGKVGIFFDQVLDTMPDKLFFAVVLKNHPFSLSGLS